MLGELKQIQSEVGITLIHLTHTQLEAIAVADLLVVMEEGRIEQAATSRDVYVLPRSAYVARFMGGQNVLDGNVASVANGVATLVGLSGERFAVPVEEATVAEGEAVFFVIRRDRIVLARPRQGSVASAEEFNVVSGTVRAIEYQGTYVKVTIDVPGRENFVANLSDSQFFENPVDIGDPVFASWSAKDVHLLRADLGRDAVGEVRGGPYGEEFDAPAG